ncbi:MAG: glycosyltransferase family 39 protein [Planctomycetes bacterium]|nr:glycosyltransferase family 39 protein [Planctomycetota bacterium]
MKARRGALLAVLGAALLLRVLAIDHSLPYKFVADTHVVRGALGMASTRDLAPPAGTFTSYPYLLPYLLLPEYAALYAAGRALGTYASAEDFGAKITDDPTPVCLIARGLVVLFGILGVLLAYRVGRRVLGRAEGLLAAYLVATSFLLVHLGKSERPWVPLVTLVLFTAERALAYARRPRLRRALLMGAAAGLAMACHQSGALAVLLPAAAVLASLRGGVARAARNAVLSAAAFALCALVIGFPCLLRGKSAQVGVQTEQEVEGKFDLGGQSFGLESFGVTNTFRVPLGVDDELFNPRRRDPAFRESLNMEPGDKLVLYVGRFWSEKGIDAGARGLSARRGRALSLLRGHARALPEHGRALPRAVWRRGRGAPPPARVDGARRGAAPAASAARAGGAALLGDARRGHARGDARRGGGAGRAGRLHRGRGVWPAAALLGRCARPFEGARQVDGAPRGARGRGPDAPRSAAAGLRGGSARALLRVRLGLAAPVARRAGPRQAGGGVPGRGRRALPGDRRPPARRAAQLGARRPAGAARAPPGRGAPLRRLKPGRGQPADGPVPAAPRHLARQPSRSAARALAHRVAASRAAGALWRSTLAAAPVSTDRRACDDGGMCLAGR